MKYHRNFIKIYFWQAFSIITGFLSLFIVTPFLTSNKEVYAIYSLCVSLTIFLSYADFGFVSAGFKYASEAYARDDRKDEFRIIGFVTWILLVFGILYCCIMLVLFIKPSIIFPASITMHGLVISRQLFGILGVFSFNMIFQRILQIILGVRLEDFILRQVTLAANCIGILSSFWFFRAGTYNIVGYYLFVQAFNFFASIIVAFRITKRYNYDWRAFFASIKLDKEIFFRTKTLAFSSLFVTITWIFYNEMDTLFISKMIGVNALAIYAVGLSLSKLVRSLLGSFYSPFSARFNHYKGLNDDSGLRNLYDKVVRYSAPLVVLSLASLLPMLRPFLISWVGNAYQESVLVATLLLSTFMLSNFHYPASILLIVELQVKKINIISLVTLLLFWAGVFATYKKIGVVSIAVFKFITFSLVGVYYLVISARFLQKNVLEVAWRVYGPLTIPIAVAVALSSFIAPLISLRQSKTGLVIVVAIVTAIILLSMGMFFLIVWRKNNKEVRSLFSR